MSLSPHGLNSRFRAITVNFQRDGLDFESEPPTVTCNKKEEVDFCKLIRSRQQ